MKFTKYSSIENSYQTPYLDKIRDAIFRGYIDKDMAWVVTEKVHGANFSVLMDGVEVRQAKRTCIIANEDNFYGSQKVLEKYKEGFTRIYDAVRDIFGGVDNPVVLVQCFGEIFGGRYPHPEVDKCKTSTPVQKGIWYCPQNDFYGFDIAYTLADGTRVFVPQSDMCEIYESCHIPSAKPLFRGSFEECLKYTNAFQTTVPSLFGLPEIENNICEGVVIKPEIDVRLANGERPLVKNKNDRFKEKCHGPKVLREAEVLPKEVQELLSTLLEYVCENRLVNVISHDSYEIPKDFGKLIKDFTSDVMEDFVKENHAQWDLMEKPDQKKLTKRMTQEASQVIKKHYEIKG